MLLRNHSPQSKDVIGVCLPTCCDLVSFGILYPPLKQEKRCKFSFTQVQIHAQPPVSLSLSAEDVIDVRCELLCLYLQRLHRIAAQFLLQLKHHRLTLKSVNHCRFDVGYKSIY